MSTRLAHHVPELVRDEALWPIAVEFTRDATEAITAFNAPIMNAWRRTHYTFAIMLPGVEPDKEHHDWRVSHLQVEPSDELVMMTGLVLPELEIRRLTFTNERLVTNKAGERICAYDILIDGTTPIHY